MRMLFIGGTQFVGRSMVEAALAAGHEVTLLHRGKTGSRLFPDATHLLADRDGDLSGLAGRSFDATVDVCAYVPRQVRSLAQALGDRGGHHVFISSVSAYDEPSAPGADESTPLVELEDKDGEEITDQTYGGLKVECERAAALAYGDALSVVRPTYVVGPWDHSGRFTWWVDRIARGGDVLCPGPPYAAMQVIDARDLASWTISLAEHQVSGAFHAASPAPPFSMRDLLDTTAAAVAPPATSLVWADADFLTASGVDGRSLPLWAEGADENVMALDTSAAQSAGLSPRTLSETVVDTWAWMRTQDSPLRPQVGLEPDREAELLATWRESSAG
jgi:2'-hydroxyisoflavone reductase